MSHACRLGRKGHLRAWDNAFRILDRALNAGLVLGQPDGRQERKTETREREKEHAKSTAATGHRQPPGSSSCEMWDKRGRRTTWRVLRRNRRANSCNRALGSRRKAVGMSLILLQESFLMPPDRKGLSQRFVSDWSRAVP